MSYTEIYSFDKQGVAHLYGEVHNAFRSGMAIWRFLESKYLPPFLPDYVKCMGCTSAKQFADKFGYVPSRTSPTMDESNVIQEIWDKSYHGKAYCRSCDKYLGSVMNNTVSVAVQKALKRNGGERE